MTKKERQNLKQAPYLAPIIADELAAVGIMTDKRKGEEIGTAMTAAYGSDAVAMSRTYAVVRYGAPFATVDKHLAASEKTQFSVDRLTALIYAGFYKAVESHGSTICRMDDLLRACWSLEKSAGRPRMTPPLFLAKGILEMGGKLSKRDVDEDGEPLISLKELGRMEDDIASDLRKIAARRGFVDFDKITALTGKGYDLSQHGAITDTLLNGVSVITGGPGTGKTTVIRGIIEAASGDTYVVLLAPTNKAADRVREATGEMATTIHGALGIVPPDLYTRFDLPQKSLVIVDESSMMDTKVAHALCEAVAAADGSCLVLVGDADQLESVGAGSVFRDLIHSGVVPVSTLTTRHRQKSGALYDNIEAIKHGDIAGIKTDETFDYIIEYDDDIVLGQAVTAYLDARQTDPDPLHTMILCPLRADCGDKYGISCRIINQFLHEYYNEDAEEAHIAGYYASAGEPVVFTANRPDLGTNGVFNGSRGIVHKIDPLTVDFDGELVEIDEDGRRALELAYATTVHKAQGSEADTVITVLPDAVDALLSRRVLYVAVTRSKKKCIVISQGEAFDKAMQDVGCVNRKTGLVKKLQKAFEDFERAEVVNF